MQFVTEQSPTFGAASRAPATPGPRPKPARALPPGDRQAVLATLNEPRFVDLAPAEVHFYQLAIPAPKPPPGSSNADAAERGDELFEGKVRCATCHVGPLYTEPGWNMHTPDEIGIDAFQADRAPDHRYRTSPLKGLWTHTTGGFYHDGRFATLRAVIDHYNDHFALGLSESEKRDPEEYLKSLGDAPVPGVSLASFTSEPGVPAIGSADVIRLASPNPSRDEVAFDVDLPHSATVEAAVFDVSGRRIATISYGERFEAGTRHFVWDGRSTGGIAVAPGVYFVRVVRDRQMWTRPVTIVR